MMANGKPETLPELQEWLRRQSENLANEANAQDVRDDFHALHIKATYAKAFAEITAKGLYMALELLIVERGEGK